MGSTKMWPSNTLQSFYLFMVLQDRAWAWTLIEDVQICLVNLVNRNWGSQIFYQFYHATRLKFLSHVPAPGGLEFYRPPPDYSYSSYSYGYPPPPQSESQCDSAQLCYGKNVGWSAWLPAGGPSDQIPLDALDPFREVTGISGVKTWPKIVKNQDFQQNLPENESIDPSIRRYGYPPPMHPPPPGYGAYGGPPPGRQRSGLMFSRKKPN